MLEFGRRRLSQTGAILTYLAELTGKFGGRTEHERLEVLRWLLFDNQKFSSFYSSLRLLVGFRIKGETELTEFLRAQGTAAVSIVEHHLQSRAFMVGDRPTIADISLVGYM